MSLNHAISWLGGNLLAEIIVGLILVPFVWKLIRWVYYYVWKARVIVDDLSLGNSPTSSCLRGIWARERFIHIYESQKPLNSDSNFPMGNNDLARGRFNNHVVDWDFLWKRGLVEIFEDDGVQKVRVKSGVLSDMVYQRMKKIQNKEYVGAQRVVS